MFVLRIRIKMVGSGMPCVVRMSVMDPVEEFDRRYPDHDDNQPHHRPGRDEVQTEAELPTTATSLVLVQEVLAHVISSPAQPRCPARERVDLGLAPVSPAHVDGEESVSHHVEGHPAHHHPGHHPLQLGGLQLYSKEDGEEGDDLGAVPDEPVAPVEDPPEGRGRDGSAEGHERLDEGEDEGGHSEDGVWVGHHEGETVGPAASVEDDDDDPGDGAGPDEEHEASVPEEPLSLPAHLRVSPRLLVIPHTAIDCVVRTRM